MRSNEHLWFQLCSSTAVHPIAGVRWTLDLSPFVFQELVYGSYIVSMLG